jgi:hypothetical protein
VSPSVVRVPPGVSLPIGVPGDRSRTLPGHHPLAR